MGQEETIGSTWLKVYITLVLNPQDSSARQGYLSYYCKKVKAKWGIMWRGTGLITDTTAVIEALGGIVPDESKATNLGAAVAHNRYMATLHGTCANMIAYPPKLKALASNPTPASYQSWFISFAGL